MTTVTSTRESAETEDDIYYTIIGSQGETAEFRTESLGNMRKLGKTDTYTFTDNTDIGEFRCVSIRNSGSDGWGFTEVMIYHS